MLRLLQNKKTQKIVLKILLFLIGPAFLFWGIGSAVREHRDTDKLSINGKRVPERLFRESFRAVYMQAQMQFGDSFPEARKFLDFENLAVQRLVLIDEALRRSIKVADSEISKVILADPSFSRKGAFDAALYEQFTRELLRMSPRQYEELVRGDLLLGKLRDEVTRAAQVSDDEVKAAYGRENDRISVVYLAAVPSEFEKGIAPSQEEMDAYFQANQQQFKVPLSVNLEYLRFDTEDAAKNALKKLAGSPAANVAKETGVEVKETGLFGQNDPIPGIGWSRQLSSLIPGLNVSQTLPALKMDQYYYAFKVKEKKDPYLPEQASIAEKIKASFVKQRGLETAKKTIEACRMKLLETPVPPSLEAAGKQFSLKYATTDLFNYNSYLEGIGVAEVFFEKASGMTPGQISELIELPSGFYLISPKEKKTVSDEDFAGAKEAFSSQVLERRKQEMFGEFVQKTLEKALR